MAIIEKLSTSQVARAIRNDENSSFYNNYSASVMLAEYLEQLSEDTGDFELDLVDIRCDYTCYLLEDFINEYDANDFDDDKHYDENYVDNLADYEGLTVVARYGNYVIIR